MTFDLRAKNAMKKHLEEILTNLKFADDTIDWESFKNDTMSALTKEILEKKKDYLTLGNIYKIIFENIFYEAKRKKTSGSPILSGSLQSIIGGEQLNILINKINKFFASIPRSYFVYFPLPMLPEVDKKEILLNDQIALVRPPKKKKVSTYAGRADTLVNAILGEIPSEQFEMYVRITSKGYAEPSLKDIPITKALSVFKQIVYLGIIEKIFIEREVRLSFSGLKSPVKFCFVIDHDKPEEEKFFTLPSNITNFILGFEIANRSSEEKLLGLSVSGIKKIINVFRKHEKFFNAPEDDEDAEPIKTAVEWAFESTINENETFAYIQMCIALDSILGLRLRDKGKKNKPEESEEPRSLTETIADRGAYLLSENIKGRKNIHGKLKDILRLRGKLVHGKSMRLKDEERNFLRLGKSYLGRVILKELSFFKTIE